jgi:hypothetical protein
MAAVKAGPDWLSRKLSARCQQQEQKLRDVLQALWPHWQAQGCSSLAYQLQFEHFPQSLLLYLVAPAAQREQLLALLPGWQFQLQQALLKKGILLKPPLRQISVCSELPAPAAKNLCILCTD